MTRLIYLSLILVLILPQWLAGADDEPPRLRLEPFLKLEKPVDLTHDPLGRMFIVEQTGRVLMCVDGAVVKPAFLDLRKEVFVEYECGLLGIVFHPQFKKNGRFYVNYTAKRPDLKTFVSEFTVKPGAAQADRTTERVILTIDQPFANHNGGCLRFGPDGMLYIGTGDGGAAHDPNNHAQDPASLLGKMLRIDVSPREGYATPPDNPFVDDPRYRPEIWATGLRNPWRYAFDRETGLLYAADVGQDLWEEIDIIEKGGNYGWRIREGFHDLHPVEDPPKMIDPIFEYSHEGTAASVTGGLVYRGKKIPKLAGWYLFADYSHGRMWGLKYEDGQVKSHAVLIDPADPQRSGGQRATQPSSFGEDADGEIYLLDANGPVYRIVAADPQGKE